MADLPRLDARHEEARNAHGERMRGILAAWIGSDRFVTVPVDNPSDWALNVYLDARLLDSVAQTAESLHMTPEEVTNRVAYYAVQCYQLFVNSGILDFQGAYDFVDGLIDDDLPLFLPREAYGFVPFSEAGGVRGLLVLRMDPVLVGDPKGT